MLQLPRRGDVVARWWAWGGIAAYLGLTVVFLSAVSQTRSSLGEGVADILGLGQKANLALSALILTGVGLTLLGMVKVFLDIRFMRTEEDDISWIERHPDAPGLVFAPAEEREELYGKGVPEVPQSNLSVETLVDDRVRRLSSSFQLGAVSPEELRIIAEKRTLPYGDLARYASSLLLLFAVLGTFAGVRAALPSLVEAASSAATQTQKLAEPLQAVADAFGANALALIGAIALGLMAQGVSQGRRNLLERLELVSTEHLYRGLARQAENPLQAAVQALTEAAEQIKGSSGALLGIEGGLQALGSDFRTAFASLETRLTDIANRHESDLHDRTSEALVSLQNRISDLTTTVASNVNVYSGLVDSIGQRTTESREAIRQLESANAALARALNDIVQVGERSRQTFDVMERASEQVATEATGVAQQISALTLAIENTQPKLRELDASFARAAEKLADVHAQAAHAWESSGREVEKTLKAVTEHNEQLSARLESGGASREVAALLRQIADGVRTKVALPTSPTAMAVAVALGVTLGGLLVYLAFGP